MREYIAFCQSQTGNKTAKVRVDSFSGHLRLGIDYLRAIHAAGTDSHDNPFKFPDFLSKSDFHEKGVFCGHMASAQNNHVIALQLLHALPAVATIAQVKTFDGKSRICQNSLKKTPHLLILGRRIGKGCDQQTAGLLFPVPPQFLCQSVCRVKTFKGCRCAAAVGTRGAAGQKKYHSVPVLSVLFYMSKLISCLLLFMFPVLYVFCSLYLRFFMPGIHYTFVP